MISHAHGHRFRTDSEIWRAVDRREAGILAIAARIAHAARVGDAILLDGDLGAGKTTFARGFLRARARLTGDEGAVRETPSPTFTLVQTYDIGGVEIWHVDLYRVEEAAELVELGLEEAFGGAISLIEWPDRLGPIRPRDPLTIEIGLAASRSSTRSVTVFGSGAWRDRLGPVLED